MKIVRASIDDATEIQQCVAAAYEHYIPRMGKAPGPMLDDYPLRIAQNEVYIIKDAGEVVALLVLIITPDQYLLDNIAVRPDQQGRGLGKQLMAFAVQRAVEMGHDAIDLYTHEVMTENIAMYSKWGYVETQRINVKGYDRIYMRKTIR